MGLSGFFDPVGLGIVLGGSLLAAAVRASMADLRAAAGALRPVFAADPAGDGARARVAVGRIQRLAEVRDLCCADRVQTSDRFLRRAARRLSDTDDAREFARWGEEELAERRTRHQAVHCVWRSIAESAPAMGLIGTVIGLVRMFAAMDDPAAVGPAMALALLTTLYGVVLANVLAAPIADRLERLSEAELAWQRRTIDQLARLAEAELSRRDIVCELRSVA